MGHAVRELFFEEPTRLFRVREIARITGVPKTSVARLLKTLLKEGLILRRKDVVWGYAAHENSSLFRLKKKIHFLEKLHACGLVGYVEDIFHPTCIVLFGSFSKGEYHKDSDIDLFVQAAKRSYDATAFEKKLRHPVNLFFEENLNALSPELFNNIINGIKLTGYIKIRS